MNSRVIIWALAFTLAACASAAHAQAPDQNSQSQDPAFANPTPSTPPQSREARTLPAAAARGVSEPDDLQPYDPANVTPDVNTLAGAQLFGVGSLGSSRNIFDPSLSVSELGQTFPSAPGQSSLYSTTLVGGALDFDRTWSRYHTIAVYSGGEDFVRGFQNLNAQFHDASISQEVDWARLHLVLRDDFIATPGASFTGTGIGGPGIITQIASTLESSLNGIGMGFIPGETIENGTVMRYMNAALGQAEYSFSRRSVLTVAGSYGLLHFTTPGFVDSHMLNTQAGYDYMLDPFDSIGFIAGYGKISFVGTSGATSNYLGALAFGRKITGRLAFQVGGGPEQIRSTSAANGGFQTWYASVTTALTYERRRDGYSLTFTRGLTSGSGVLLGAKSNIFTVGAHRDLTRHWTTSVNGGYAINNSLTTVNGSSQRFDNWFIAATLGSQLGRHALLNFSYGLQRQYSPPVCPVTSCGVSGYQQSFGMTLNWHLRPNE
ncbi:MAG: hypothetical protein ACRD4Y_14190 [Candidatus Acidiferrales bacterium]